MKKEDKKGTNNKKIKWLIVGYSLLFISILTFCLLNYEDFAFCFFEIVYLALFFILTLPFIIGIEVTNKKIIYPLYYVVILLLTWEANTLTYFTYSSLTLSFFARGLVLLTKICGCAIKRWWAKRWLSSSIFVKTSRL